MTPVLAGAAVLLLAAGVAALVLRRQIVVVSVSGSSMAPTLRPGDRVLVRRRQGNSLRHGDVVVVGEPGPCRPGDPTGTRGSRWLIKRVAALPGDPEPAFLPAWARHRAGVVPPGHLVLVGDNTVASRDSRVVGAFPADRVLGVALRRLGGSSAPPPSRPVSRSW